MKEWIYEMEIRSASVYLRLCCSVGDNLKPEQLFGEMFRSYGHDLPPFALQVHRLDLLTRVEGEQEPAEAGVTGAACAGAAGSTGFAGFVSLGELGQRIV